MRGLGSDWRILDSRASQVQPAPRRANCHMSQVYACGLSLQHYQRPFDSGYNVHHARLHIYSYTGHHSITVTATIISPFHHRRCSLPRTERRISDTQRTRSLAHPPHPALRRLLLRLDTQHELLDCSVLLLRSLQRG